MLRTLVFLAGEAESGLGEADAVVPWPAWAYGLIALVVLLSLLLVVTRLNLDR